MSGGTSTCFVSSWPFYSYITLEKEAKLVQTESTDWFWFEVSLG